MQLPSVHQEPLPHSQDICKPKLQHSHVRHSLWPSFHSQSKLHFPSTHHRRSQWPCNHLQQGFLRQGPCQRQLQQHGIIHHREHPPPRSCYGEAQQPSPNYCTRSDYPSLQVNSETGRLPIVNSSLLTSHWAATKTQ